MIGNIGDKDVDDCANLIKKGLDLHSDLVDPSRVAVYGGSHGGFLTGWMIGHPTTKDLFAASILWNPVINMSFMETETDIPDWIFGCCFSKELSWQLTPEENNILFNKSPISVVSNVKTPALLIIGGKDFRVPPAQGVRYHQILKSQGVPTKLHYYPEDGHAVAATEPGMDALFNMISWLDQHLAGEEGSLN